MKIINMNKDWKFSLDNPAAPHLLNSCEDGYRNVDIPHDWSVEFPFDKDKGEGCTGFLLGGFGWYRKRFVTTHEMQDKRVFLYFDGIYNNASIYINGKFIEMHPYGYSPFYYDITHYLNEIDEDNLIAVSVDRTRYADSRWYTGSGIYRDVELLIADKVHIPIWATSVNTSDISNESCNLNISTQIANEYSTQKSVDIKYSVLLGGAVIKVEKVSMALEAGKINDVKESIIINNPKLWDTDRPNLYELLVEIIADGIVVDAYSTTFGVRDFCFDADKGFFLNGKSTLIKGLCLHHSCGLLGSKMYVDAWRRRLHRLKECGCNAIRTAHNPMSSSFLDLCDEMGFLVQEEFFDEWDNPKDKRHNCTLQSVDYLTNCYTEHFQQWAKKDLQNTVLRDRNHPCIIQWSIGNEIEWTYPKYNKATGYFGANASGNYFWDLPPYDTETIKKNIEILPEEQYEIGKTAKKLSAWTKEIDITRPIVANCIFPTASYESGYTDALDIVGFSYRQVVYEHCHNTYPEKPIMGCENLGQWHEWKQVIEKEYISGIFLWTGIDYMGEAGNPSSWPTKGTPAGLLDIAGFEKHSYYMYKSLWQDEPTIHIATQMLEKSLYTLDENDSIVEKIKDGWKKRLWHWHDMNYHWNYSDNEDVIIEIYSNCEEITLYLDNTNLGTKQLSQFDDHIYKWHTKFTKGTLRAVGTKDGKDIIHTLVSASKPTWISLELDEFDNETKSEGIYHIKAQLMDKNNNPVMHDERRIEFAVNSTENVQVLGIDNGHVDNVNMYQSMSVDTNNGKCLFMIKIKGDEKVTVRAKSDDISSNDLVIK